ncbi:MAG: FtsB family cell division protein [Nocardioidaceae bacterium]
MPSRRRTPDRGARSGPGRSRTPAPRRARVPGVPVAADRPGGRARSLVTSRAAVLLLVLLVLVMSYASSLRAWLEQRDQINAARADITRTQTAVAGLQQEQRRWKDPAYIEAQARLRFSWVLPGEVGYRVVDRHGQTLGSTEHLAAAPSKPTRQRPAWYSSLWGSVQAAGQDPVQPVVKPKVHRPGAGIIRVPKHFVQ